MASLWLDTPAGGREAVLARECGEDAELREHVLRVCRDYSETDEFFGAPVMSPLAAAREDTMPGQQIGPWKVRRLLGEGGMGRVYLVERVDGVFSQLAALKINREHADAEAIRRFEAERQILAMLEHPSIARAIDGGATADGMPYLVMEYVAGGRPIDEFCPESTVRDKIRLFLPVVEAVVVAHRRQVAHRDLKPANILVTPEGLPKVLDFGIAKLFLEAPAAAQPQTQAAQAALTPTFASPEQLRGEPASLASDVYSLGAVLYKMLTGRPPHDLTGLNILQAVQRVTQGDPAPPSAHAKESDAEADAMVMKALERAPARRYGSAEEFAADLRRYLEGVPVKARAQGRVDRMRRQIRGQRGAVAAAAAVAVLMVAGGKALRERWVEQERLGQVRTSVRPVIAEYQSQLARLSVSTALRNQIASDEKHYLDGLLVDAGQEPELRRQVATAYGRLAYYQTDAVEAQDSLRKAMSLWRGFTPGQLTPADRLEMAGAGRRLGWSEINMGKLTEARRSLEEGLRQLDSLAGTTSEEAGKVERVGLLFEQSRLGAWAGQGEQAIRYAQQAVAEHEKLPAKPLDRRGIAITRMQLADAADSYGAGQPEWKAEALKQARLAVRAVREAPPCEELACREVKASVLTRAPAILIHHDLVDEALGLRDGVDLAEKLLVEDAGNPSALASLRFGLFYQGWGLKRAGRLEECLRVRRRLLEVSTVSGRKPGPAEDRLKEAIACGEVGRILVDLNRPGEALGYFERQAEILAHPPTENVHWFMRQADVHQDLGALHERMGRPEAARAEFAKASVAAETFLAKTGSPWAKAVLAGAHYLQGKALLATDRAAGCELLGRSLAALGELAKAGPLRRDWKASQEGAAVAARGCGL